MNCPAVPVLLVHQSPTKCVPLLEHLASQKIPVVATDNFNGIESIRATNKYSMILCDWELFQTQQNNPQDADSVKELFDSKLPVIFFSALQSASVKFRQVNTRSVYSMKTADCPKIFDTICELAKQVDRPPSQSSAKAESIRHSIGREQAPHFFPALVIDAANANSCVHGLY